MTFDMAIAQTLRNGRRWCALECQPDESPIRLAAALRRRGVYSVVGRRDAFSAQFTKPTDGDPHMVVVDALTTEEPDA